MGEECDECLVPSYKSSSTWNARGHRRHTLNSWFGPERPRLLDLQGGESLFTKENKPDEDLSHFITDCPSGYCFDQICTTGGEEVDKPSVQSAVQSQLCLVQCYDEELHLVESHISIIHNQIINQTVEDLCPFNTDCPSGYCFDKYV